MIKIIVNMSVDIHLLHRIMINTLQILMLRKQNHILSHKSLYLLQANNSAKSDKIWKKRRRVNLTRPSLLTCKQFSWCLAASDGGYSFNLKLLNLNYTIVCVRLKHWKAHLSKAQTNSNLPTITRKSSKREC